MTLFHFSSTPDARLQRDDHIALLHSFRHRLPRRSQMTASRCPTFSGPAAPPWLDDRGTPLHVVPDRPRKRDDRITLPHLLHSSRAAMYRCPRRAAPLLSSPAARQWLDDRSALLHLFADRPRHDGLMTASRAPLFSSSAALRQFDFRITSLHPCPAQPCRRS